ncbi:hypothetical protein [Sulfurospirillum multivorans]|uniref:Uncharacterized protein n=2 Tax=Sulfurospirillum multivorans TaxID=66821 RepID=A0AA86ALJ0_SULMK|nr:hypothetical protein [Sulfurospirillum multivorans]AHJ11728.1 hypothetical protein SMUL_0447 [Sulfurospirillum multivorans DSM 12446]QEH05234.1 hypothetical protein SMN_0446 [Sulfurospirillum multivorans]
MDNRLFEIDPYAGVSYGLYNSLKGEEGSFEDFLLHYDSTGASEGDSSWLTDLINQDTLSALSSTTVLEAMNTLGVSALDFGNSTTYFDSQVYAAKMQLMQAFSQRDDYEEMKPLLDQLMS